MNRKDFDREDAVSPRDAKVSYDQAKVIQTTNFDESQIASELDEKDIRDKNERSMMILEDHTKELI